jgi:catechol 2,3-dioxygenase-like lactoylglutathione lyase family enzyme
MSFINLLVLRCADVARTREFYECLELEFDGHRHGNGPVHSGTMDGMGLILELYPASEKNPVDRSGLGFGAPDLERIIAALLSRGFEPGKIEKKPWGNTFVVRDPDGRRVEVKFELSSGDPEFETELKSRIEQVERGEEKGIPWQEVRDSLKRDETDEMSSAENEASAE